MGMVNLTSESGSVLDLGSGQPFKQFAVKYLEAGWLPLPLPPGEKSPPPRKFTGHHPSPVRDDIERWLDDQPDRSNIGIRVPDGVIGIDVDAYGGKQGGLSLAALTEAFGPLPPTWTLSARADGLSGIRFYTVPIGLAWPGEAAADIQVVQYRHRYAVAFPSIHPSLKKMYRWYEPEAPIDGQSFANGIPDISSLLPLGDGDDDDE